MWEIGFLRGSKRRGEHLTKGTLKAVRREVFRGCPAGKRRVLAKKGVGWHEARCGDTLIADVDRVVPGKRFWK